MPSLIVIRHGSTQWTKEKRFTGWSDVPLDQKADLEIGAAVADIRRHKVVLHHCYTSQLSRAKDTAIKIIEALGGSLNQLSCDWRLNERHYGALQGELRREMVKCYGRTNVHMWRNHYFAMPPPIPLDDPRWAARLSQFTDIPASSHPRSESMAMAANRVQAFWHEEIVPALRENRNLMIVAHTNSIRSIVGDLENLTIEQRGAFRIRPAKPRYFKLDHTLQPQRSPLKAIKTWRAFSK